MNETECCQKFFPKPWERKLLKWTDKKFIKENLTTFFHMPLNFGGVMKKLDEQVREANANIPDGVCLSYHTSKWKMNVYLAVYKKIPCAENKTFNGKFLSKVYDGPFQNTAKWCKDFEQFISRKGMRISKWFMWYTTCPKCAKKIWEKLSCDCLAGHIVYLNGVAYASNGHHP